VKLPAFQRAEFAQGFWALAVEEGSRAKKLLTRISVYGPSP
jgi:hypothetical protein